jgi:hypothetical protein
MKKSMKLAETKIAKQLSAYTLIHYDLEYSARAFAQAADLSSQREKIDAEKIIQSRLSQLALLDPILRAGAAVAQMDKDRLDSTSVVKGALFEAAIVTYARCFVSGARSCLSEKVFRGELSGAIKFHNVIIQLRNKHIAHSELKQELSIIGFQLVNDPAYGKRPSTIISAIAARRYFPSKEELKKLSNHCVFVDEKAVQPIILKNAKALREELLKMSSEEIDQMKDFGEAPSNIDPLIS